MREVYRRMLRAADYYPSIKRASVIKEIKEEFRQNKDMPEGKELTARIEEAHTVMHQLERYSGSSSQDQMGERSHKWHYAMRVPER